MTSFDEIEDLSMVVVDDYKLVKLFKNSEEDFKRYIDGFLKQAVGQFTKCRQSLAYDANMREFEADLTNQEISILADLVVINWWKRETNNAAQIALKLKVSGSFTFNSESQNFKEKQIIINKLEEQVNRKITQYELADILNY